jgi:hypothetical protein
MCMIRMFTSNPPAPSVERVDLATCLPKSALLAHRPEYSGRLPFQSRFWRRISSKSTRSSTYIETEFIGGLFG